MINDEVLEGQLPEFKEEAPVPEVKEEVKEQEQKPEQAQEPESLVGKKLRYKSGDSDKELKEKYKEVRDEKHLSKIGDTLGQNFEIREGWLEVDKLLMGERAMYYPQDWRFRIRPATVEAIRNWSTIDDENVLSVDEVFNEILKSCLSILTPMGPLPWGNIHPWDRLWFILLIREYTFVEGETAIIYKEPCVECDNDVEFKLISSALMYDMPDKEVMKHFNVEEQTWYINPQEYDLSWPEPITLYLPTLEKEANIKAWMINKLQQNRNAKIDQVFMRFLPWMAPKIAKDLTIAQRQIREYEIKFKSWDEDMFSFMDDVIKNINILPSTKLITKCPVCGEENTSEIRFPDGISSLFNVSRKYKKFGKK